jgi:hypothetical protein
MMIKHAQKSGIALLLILSLIFIVPLKSAFPLGYWDAIFELGFDPMSEKVDLNSACERIERINLWRGLVVDHLEKDKSLNAKIRDLEARITSLDAGNLYGIASYAGRDQIWRGIGVRGESYSDGYRMYIANPEIDNWLYPPTQGYSWLQGFQQHFGDTSLRAFIKPGQENTYRFASEGYFYLDDIPLANGLRMTKALWQTALSEINHKKNSSGTFSQRPLAKHHQLQLSSGFATSFPNLFRLISRYFEVETDVSSAPTFMSELVVYDIKLRVRGDALKKDYPELEKLLRRMNGMFSSKTRIHTEDGQLIGTVEFDSGADSFALRFSRLSQSLETIPGGIEPEKVEVFPRPNPEYTKLYLVHHIHLNFFGLHFDIEELKMPCSYSNKKDAPHLLAQINQPPKEVKAYGRAFGFFPIWLIDLLIPSNVENIMQSFYETLAMSNEGRGARIKAGSFSTHPYGHTFGIATDADVLANGTIKMAFNLHRKMLAKKKKLSQEIKSFRNQLWSAFYQDFNLIKSLRFATVKQSCSE